MDAVVSIPVTDAAGLAAYAAHDAFSKGRQYPQVKAAHRSEFQRDRERIIHSTAFRRLEYKTQVFVNHEGDLFRTRLTHSIEVAQIARGAARALRLNQDLCEAIALAHDLGHTPFGHVGQEALNECMGEHGRFEHNLQSLRIVDKLELKYPQFCGLNLTFETREGILKYCSRSNAEKLGALGQRFLHKTQPSLEAQLTNVADEIAYSNHDLDDGLRAGLITVEQLSDVVLFDRHFAATAREYPNIDVRRKIHESVRRIINEMVTDLIDASQAIITQKRLASIDDVRADKHPLIRFSDLMQSRSRELKSFLRKNLYQHYRVHRKGNKAKKIISDLYAAFYDDACLMPDEYREKANICQQQKGDSGRARVVSDYIAGMTDRYAIAEHERIFNARVI